MRVAEVLENEKNTHRFRRRRIRPHHKSEGETNMARLPNDTGRGEKRMKIPIDRITVSKDNPRQNFDEESLRSLGESIKTHGQLQAISVRQKGSGYELITGERRFRASAMVGLETIEADIKNVDDGEAMELRLIENTQREDLSDAEKGDAVLALWANSEKYATLEDVAITIGFALPTVKDWVQKARRLSPKIKDMVAHTQLTDEHACRLLKYPNSVQEKLANTIIKRGISSHKEVLRRFIKLYDANPQRSLNQIADEVLGIKTVTIPTSMLSPELEKKIEEQRQLAKIQRLPRKKPNNPITKEQVKEKLAKEKTDFKYVRARISHGSGTAPPLKTEIKPIAMPIPITPDYNALCQCATCQLFAKHCKGRCWT